MGTIAKIVAKIPITTNDVVASNWRNSYDRHMLLTGNQLKAARALAAVDQAWVAKAANVAVNTIRNMESRGSRIHNERRSHGQERSTGPRAGWYRVHQWQPARGKNEAMETWREGAITRRLGTLRFNVRDGAEGSWDGRRVSGAYRPNSWGHFRLRLASGTVTGWLSTIYFETA